jgi:hypothetical protein
MKKCNASLSSSLILHPSSPENLGHTCLGILLQLAGVGVEFANAFGQLLRGHRVLVVHPTKCLLVHVEALFLACLRLCRIELALQGTSVCSNCSRSSGLMVSKSDPARWTI